MFFLERPIEPLPIINLFVICNFNYNSVILKNTEYLLNKKANLKLRITLTLSATTASKKKTATKYFLSYVLVKFKILREH